MQMKNNHADVASIAMCICTRQRPIMLGKCLEKISSMVITSRCRLEILVIENDISPQCKEIIDKYNRNTYHNIHYFLEEKIGISAARNRSIEEALKIGTEWIAFIDDDAYPDKDWLEAYLECMVKHPADVYDGSYVLVYPENAPDYLQIQPHIGIDGEQLRFASTGNVLLHKKLVAIDGLNMRFNTEFSFIGGEDYELFKRASSQGIAIRRSTGAIVYETITHSRATFAWNLSRRFRFGQVNICVSQLHNGLSYTLMRKMILGIMKVLSGVVGLPLLPLWPLSVRIRRYVFQSMCRIAYGIGLFAGLLNLQNKYYQNTDGM